MARRSLAFNPPPALPIMAGATAPNPGGIGATVWSTTELRLLHWDGSEWVAQAVLPDVIEISGGQDKTYVHTQGVADTTWVVAHGLNKIPSVTVIDSLGDEVRGDVRHDSTNQLTLTFAYPFSGSAFCN